VPSDIAGIYRCKRGEEVVYIGRGPIRERYSSPERRAWEITRIEYSIVADAREQENWESHWLERYREDKGSLPIYNKIMAAKGD
jgi:hypothetical protein